MDLVVKYLMDSELSEAVQKHPELFIKICQDAEKYGDDEIMIENYLYELEQKYLNGEINF